MLFVAIGGLVALVGGCSKPTPLTGTYTATCSFKGGYRGGGRADLAWSRQCTVTLEARSETEVAMRFDSGDSVECYGHAVQTGANGERKVSFPKNDLTCRAKTLPAPAGIAVEQCPMPGTFSISEAIDKNKKSTVAVSVTLEVADKRACVFSYLDKVAIDGKLATGGTPVTIEAFQDAGAAPLFTPPGRELPPPVDPRDRDGGPPHDAGKPAVDAGPLRDASTK